MQYIEAQYDLYIALKGIMRISIGKMKNPPNFSKGIPGKGYFHDEVNLDNMNKLWDSIT